MNENVETGREKRMIVNGLNHDILVEANTTIMDGHFVISTRDAHSTSC